jgi:hypothetical protein
LTIEFHPEAAEDLAEAVGSYDRASAHLTEQFLEEFRWLVTTAAGNP